jgi:DNA polymerase-3 subunit epsilon
MSVGLNDVDFAVIDFETTGLSPYHHDRVIEVAIVRLVAGGRLTEEYVSLVNPGRDLGPTRIHGITAKDILDAPQFGEIVGDVLERLADAVIVAHNVQFDKTFLVAECERAGYSLPDFPTLCTMRLSSILSDSNSGRALPDCCAHFGVDLAQHHAAEDDARACALLLAKCLAVASGLGIQSLDELIGSQTKFPTAWPKVAPSGKTLRRSDAERLRKSQPHYLARLVTRLMGPEHVTDLPPHVTDYMGLLDKVLEDRLVTEVEADSLYSFAKTYGLSGEQVVATHRRYLASLAQAAWADGQITESEQRDLLDVTKLLGFDQQILAAVMDEAHGIPVSEPSDGHNLMGKSVCFTGALLGCVDGAPIDRAQAEQLAVNAGLIVAPRVTKSLDILVVADPHTLSGKAKKAREYGTRIMAEMAFWNAIGVAVE